MREPGHRDCVPLEVEMISLHRGTGGARSRRRRPRRRRRVVARLLGRLRSRRGG